MSDDIAYVALLGPVRAGKTVLVPSLQRSARYTHGLHRDIAIKIEEDRNFDVSTEGEAAGDPAGELGFKAVNLKQVSRSVIQRDYEPASTNVASISQYPLQVTLEPRGRPQLVRRMSIIDSGGGLMLATDQAKEQRELAALDSGGREERRRAELTKVLQETVSGIVFCIDVTWRDTDEWEQSFDELLKILEGVKVTRDRPPMRIALTFTKTDQLFLLEGSDAARQALSRSFLRRRLGQVIESGEAIHTKWRELQLKNPDKVEIGCFATSVFGYIHENGCVNYSFNRKSWLLGDDNLREALGLVVDAGGDETTAEGGQIPLLKHWRPMLTLDPFLFAAFGDQTELGGEMISRFMFTLDDFLGEAPEMPPPQSSGGGNAGLFGKFFNRSGR